MGSSPNKVPHLNSYSNSNEDAEAQNMQQNITESLPAAGTLNSTKNNPGLADEHNANSFPENSLSVKSNHENFTTNPNDFQHESSKNNSTTPTTIVDNDIPNEGTDNTTNDNGDAPNNEEEESE